MRKSQNIILVKTEVAREQWQTRTRRIIRNCLHVASAMSQNGYDFLLLRYFFGIFVSADSACQ